MKYGVNTWAWESPLTTETFDRLAPKVAEMGFDVIEIPLWKIDLLDFDRMAALVTEHGLEVSAIPMGYDLVHEDEEVRDDGLELLRHCVEIVATLGGHHLGVPMAVSAETDRFGKDTEAREGDLRTLVDELIRLSNHAEDYDVVLGVEPLNRFETNLINTTNEAIKIVDRVDHDACQLLLDPFHMNIEEFDIGEAIRTAGSRIGHFHACSNTRGTPGDGHLPWDDIVTSLEAAGFGGPLVIETFTPYREAIARPECVWRPLASSQDEIVENGLAFLESRFE